MNAAVDRHAALLARNGWCVFGRAVEPALIAGIEADLKPRFIATPLCEGPFYGERTRRFGSLLTHSAAIERLAMHPLILEIVEQMLLPWCERIALNLTQAIEIHPGALPQPPHRDQDMWQGPIITTDRRTYHLQLESTATTAMSALSWTYPQDELRAIKRAADQHRAATPVASGLAVEQLNFGSARRNKPSCGSRAAATRGARTAGGHHDRRNHRTAGAREG